MRLVSWRTWICLWTPCTSPCTLQTTLGWSTPWRKRAAERSPSKQTQNKPDKKRGGLRRGDGDEDGGEDGGENGGEDEDEDGDGDRFSWTQSPPFGTTMAPTFSWWNNQNNPNNNRGFCESQKIYERPSGLSMHSGFQLLSQVLKVGTTSNLPF